ncbi:trans-sulfuration enzyme family protein [Candidatus Korobacter versatilis]|nr:PLP-dependent transferase [Candidatus Koribacter versatilis]
MADSIKKSHGFQTIAVHAGRNVDPSTGAVAMPIYPSTTFERDTDGAFSRGYSYIRDANPNRKALEACLSALEVGEEAIAFSSGMGATFSVFQILSPGDHVVLHRDMYYGVRELINGIFTRYGIQHTVVDMRNLDETRAAVRPGTKLFWLETPTNPLIEVVAIEPIAAIAHEHGALFACENTFATPALQRPLELGADLVVHSLTKYLSGHSDAMGGAVILKRAGDLAHKIRDFQHNGGAVLSPFDCWLILRGIESLPARMRIHCENAQKIAEFLSAHAAVSKVRYPGLTNDPGHAIAKRQMRAFGGMLSFEIRGARAEAFLVSSRFQLIIRATSLGGTHTLVEHRASIEGAHTRAPESLLRMSVGLEDTADLIDDLDQALTALPGSLL